MAQVNAISSWNCPRSPALMDFSEDEEDGGAWFAPAGETQDEPPFPSRPPSRSDDSQSGAACCVPDGDRFSPFWPPLSSLLPTPPKVNSVRVPFDPDDQSDDEVIVTSVYHQRTAPAKDSDRSDGRSAHSSSKINMAGTNNANVNDHRKANAAGKERQGGHINASLSASPVFGKSTAAGRVTGSGPSLHRNPAAATTHPVAAPEIPLVPLSEISSARGQPRPSLVIGSAYPGKPKFCPWSKVIHYHTQFVGKVNSARVAPYFALGELLKCQVWDLCYLWHPAKDKLNTHVLVVPTEQVAVLLERINKTLNIHLTIPTGDLGDAFRVVFGSQKTPVPRFLGHAGDPDAMALLVKNIPPRHPGDTIATPKSRAFFLKRIESLLGNSDQKKNKSEKAKKKRSRERKRWGRQIKRIQRYLGLRKNTETTQEGNLASDQAVMDIVLRPRVLDLTKPAPFEPEGDVIFVAMDIESYEHNHGTLTEIGFAVLDTRDVIGVPPGANGETWQQHIQARHIRIREHAHMVNRQFLQGCENNFLFGTSEFVRLREVLPLVTSMLQPSDQSHEPRKVVLVGHDIRSDISLVKNIGFYVRDGMFLEVVDTQDLHQHLRLNNQQAGLRAVLRDLDIEHMFLHNAGNDAVFTMQALITVVLEKRQNSLRKQSERMDPSYKPDPETVEQGWDTGGELSDGGLAEDDVPSKDNEVSTERRASASGGGSPGRPSSKPSSWQDTTPRRMAPSPQKAKRVVPWPVIGPLASPPVTAAWPALAGETEDLISL